jgi:hypothetical protein
MSRVYLPALAVVAIVLIIVGAKAVKQAAENGDRIEIEVNPRDYGKPAAENDSTVEAAPRDHRRPAAEKEFTEEEREKYDQMKTQALEEVLGPMDKAVWHSPMPYALGGSVDMYCFSKGIPGTGMATMELIEPDGKGVQPNKIGTFELVAFTRLTWSKNAASEDQAEFEKIKDRMCGVLTGTAQCARLERIEPGDTGEMPVDKETCWLLYDEYRGSGEDFVIDGKRHCLLLCMEIFESEGRWAMKNAVRNSLPR